MADTRKKSVWQRVIRHLQPPDLPSPIPHPTTSPKLAEAAAAYRQQYGIKTRRPEYGPIQEPTVRLPSQEFYDAAQKAVDIMQRQGGGEGAAPTPEEIEYLKAWQARPIPTPLGWMPDLKKR